MLLATGAIALAGRRRARNGLIAAACLVSALWEAFDTGGLLSDLLRYSARDDGWYFERRSPQQLATVIVISAMAAFALLLLGYVRRKERLVPWLSISAIWGISLLRVFSLHELDAVLTRPLFGIQSGQLATAAFSLLFLGASVIRLRPV
jgi:hypothetical protein